MTRARPDRTVWSKYGIQIRAQGVLTFEKLLSGPLYFSSQSGNISFVTMKRWRTCRATSGSSRVSTGCITCWHLQKNRKLFFFSFNFKSFWQPKKDPRRYHSEIDVNSEILITCLYYRMRVLAVEFDVQDGLTFPSSIKVTIVHFHFLEKYWAILRNKERVDHIITS